MEDRIRDRLIRTLRAAAFDRRAGLRALGGGALAALLARVWQDDAGAKKKRKKCKRSQKKCRKRCIPKRNCCRNGECSGGKTCQRGTCRCPAGQDDSGGVCAPHPDCLGNGSTCASDDVCCSGSCPSSIICACSTLGLPCHIDGDCCDGNRCVGFVCRA